jgi:hypothetical protein
MHYVDREGVDLLWMIVPSLVEKSCHGFVGYSCAQQTAELQSQSFTELFGGEATSKPTGAAFLQST